MFNPFKHKPPVVVLGMHRSGTSCLTGTLEEAGVYLGEVFRWNPYNKKGNRENQQIMDLHDGILAANGGSWSSPPESPVLEWSDEHRSTRDRIISEYGRFGTWRFGNAYWGFKDPRTLLVLEGWLEVLTDIKAIGIFRHPERVVKSLQNRDSSITDEAGLRLWLRYNERLLDYQREMGFPLVCFDDSDAELKDKFVTILSDLGIAKDRLAFFEPRLRSAPREGMEIPEDVSSLYQALRQRAL